MAFFLEFIRFLSSQKKLWLAPLFFVMILFGAILFLAKGTVVAPFIYTLF